MNLVKFGWIIIQILIGYNLILPILFYVFYLSGKKEKKGLINPVESDYAIIVTAYQQTDLLQDVVSSLLKLNYKNYLVYIVADNCDVSDLSFNDDRIILLRPEQILASNTRSHLYAFNHFKRPHKRVTIIDSDNLVDENYLIALDSSFDNGFDAVQGVRKAKNTNTMLACLDAARDLYYHFYDGELLFNLGSSATLAGSGMAFTTTLYEKFLENNNISGAGFDKVLQYKIVNSGLRIAYNKDAIVYDEKTAHSDQLVKQRARWINTWFKYYTIGFKLFLKGVWRIDKNQFLFGLILLRPPLFIFLLLSVVFLLINIFISIPIVMIWIGLLLSFVLGFFIALKKNKADKEIYLSLRNIPHFVFFQVISLFKIRKANEISVASRHSFKKL